MPTRGCSCTCCEDARERIRCGGEPKGLRLRDACWCRLYSRDERCDCAFCVDATVPLELGATLR